MARTTPYRDWFPLKSTMEVWLSCIIYSVNHLCIRMAELTWIMLFNNYFVIHVRNVFRTSDNNNIMFAQKNACFEFASTDGNECYQRNPCRLTFQLIGYLVQLVLVVLCMCNGCCLFHEFSRRSTPVNFPNRAWSFGPYPLEKIFIV